MPRGEAVARDHDQRIALGAESKHPPSNQLCWFTAARPLQMLKGEHLFAGHSRRMHRNNKGV